MLGSLSAALLLFVSGRAYAFNGEHKPGTFRCLTHAFDRRPGACIQRDPEARRGLRRMHAFRRRPDARIQRIGEHARRWSRTRASAGDPEVADRRAGGLARVVTIAGRGRSHRWSWMVLSGRSAGFDNWIAQCMTAPFRSRTSAPALQ